VERCVRRQGVGSILFRRLISEAKWKGYRRLRITTGANNGAMRALANKFGARLVFRWGESMGTIDVPPQPQAEAVRRAIDTPRVAARAMMNFCRACRRLFSRMSGSGRSA
jgi:Acetyltransferase (GNAT) family